MSEGNFRQNGIGCSSGEGLGLPLILPVSTVIARHRAAYYDEIEHRGSKKTGGYFQK